MYLVLASLALAGCTSGKAPLVDIAKALAIGNLGRAGIAEVPARPDPRYAYLRVERVGQPPALLVLGYRDPHPLGDIEVWYSARREVIKTQHGRIVATAGLEVDWRMVRHVSVPPAWGGAGSPGGAYQRSRDEMPGYRFSLLDHIQVSPQEGVPPIGLPAALPIARARSYTWFRESMLSSSSQPLPPAWFALGQLDGRPAVVYSEQCLSPTYCLRLMPWPPQEPSP